VFSFSHSALDTDELKSSLAKSEAGALAVFEGWVRNHNDGRSVLALTYEAMEPLAIKEGNKIIEEARTQFDIYDAICQHRVGELTVGDVAVWVGVCSAHRGTAFDACRYIIDQIKLRLPIWKKETYTDGTSDWVNCQSCAHPPKSSHDADSHAASHKQLVAADHSEKKHE
jgi:molybdopterin synthase catalytic subunit